MQAQWSAHSLRTRLPEPQVWGGWGPTPKERCEFLLEFSDLAYKLECGVPESRRRRHKFHITPTTPQASEFARAIRPRPPVAVVRVHTLPRRW